MPSHPWLKCKEITWNEETKEEGLKEVFKKD